MNSSMNFAMNSMNSSMNWNLFPIPRAADGHAAGHKKTVTNQFFDTWFFFLQS